MLGGQEPGADPLRRPLSGEPSPLLPLADKVVKRDLDATTDEITSELQEVLKSWGPPQAG